MEGDNFTIIELVINMSVSIETESKMVLANITSPKLNTKKECGSVDNYNKQQIEFS